ncbi:MAG: DegT/DnrJ/EryC1/StrS family aminotransferase [Planctomycetes bacterium]|nr:DegT/DnrJ/EryC1/StrS family aminotransferase [Planctomycetota bacterium]
MIKPFEEAIYVTRPYLPPLEAFCDELKEIWKCRWLTNEGPIVRRFVRQLSHYFETDNICLFNNGTLALQLALQGMDISGEVITTPFTFVATTHALFWNKIRPVFVDIEPQYYTLDPEKVEAALTPWTTAILAVHVYGHPCRVHALADIARRHHLKLIYDAAHAFGVKVGGRSIAHFGDMNMFSFHATKPFHSIEGGMLTFRDSGLKKKLDYLKNFGFENEVEVVMPGTNAKMNEFQALMGSMILGCLDELIARRRRIAEIYRERLSDLPGIRFPPPLPEDVQSTHAYLPVEIDNREFPWSRDELYEQLKTYNIYTRRYFYPLICDYTCYRHLALQDPLTVARRVASCILTLPIYPDLAEADVHRVCDIIHHIRKEHRPSASGALVASPALLSRPGAPVPGAEKDLVTS